MSIFICEFLVKRFLFPKYLCIIDLPVLDGVSDADFLPVSEHIFTMSSGIDETDEEDFVSDIASGDIFTETAGEVDTIAFGGPGYPISIGIPVGEIVVRCHVIRLDSGKIVQCIIERKSRFTGLCTNGIDESE